MRFSTRDLFIATTLLAVAAFGVSLLFKQDAWGPGPRLPVFFVSATAAGAGLSAPFQSKVRGAWIGFGLGLAYFCCELGIVGVSQFFNAF